jgi:hypothetical protein
MNSYFPFTATGVFFDRVQAQIPALVYWMPVGFPGAMHAEYPVARETIEQVAFKEPNWDGYGALPISVEAKRNAIGAIESILAVAPTPEISPNPNGTLSFEWGTGEGTAHMEIGRTRYSFYVSPRVGVPILYEGSVDEVNRIHGSLVASLLFPPTNSAGTMTPIRYSTNVRHTD